MHRLQAHLEIIEAMINQEASVIDIVTELNRAIALARQAGLLVLEHHVTGCLLDTPTGSTGTPDARARQLIQSIRRFTLAVS